MLKVQEFLGKKTNANIEYNFTIKRIKKCEICRTQKILKNFPQNDLEHEPYASVLSENN